MDAAVVSPVRAISNLHLYLASHWRYCKKLTAHLPPLCLGVTMWLACLWGRFFFSFLKEYFTKRSKFCLLPSLPSICSNYLFLPCFAWSYEKRFANIRWQCKNKVNMPGMVEGEDGRSLGPWWHHRAPDAILHLDLLLERNKPLFDETTAIQALCYLQLNDPN